MTQTVYDPAFCAYCQVKPIGARRSKYCDQKCADKAASRQRGEAAMRFHERVGGHRAFHLKQRYGISEEQYDEMFHAQRGRCAVCGRKVRTLHVDHDHLTNVVRGLLCQLCNTAIGKMDDDPARLRLAAEYIERYR